jgi:hypothetical protein
MKVVLLLAIGWIVSGGMASLALAEDAHTVITPNEVEWGAASKALPSGAQAAILYGAPAKEGPFALRLHPRSVEHQVHQSEGRSSKDTIATTA